MEQKRKVKDVFLTREDGTFGQPQLAVEFEDETCCQNITEDELDFWIDQGLVYQERS
jgi:hypothetical protein